jgi:hypothetical protein
VRDKENKIEFVYRDSDSTRGLDAIVTMTVYAVAVWESGAVCTRRRRVYECVHRDTEIMTAIVHVMNQCIAATDDCVHRDEDGARSLNMTASATSYTATVW